MNVVSQMEGAVLLLDTLSKVREGSRLKEADIIKILSHSDIQQWLNAYDWIENAFSKFEQMLRSLHEKSPPDLGQWGNKIDEGLRNACKRPKKMRDTLQTIKSYDWNAIVQKTLEYLPEHTKLEPKMIVTIDGFNAGMFRYETVFLSLVYFDPSPTRMSMLAHEFHHMGVDVWWQKDPLIRQFRDKPKQEDRTAYFVQLFTYLVGEGMANALCSPQAITKINGEGKRVNQHNKMIKTYKARQNTLFDRLERIIDHIMREKSMEELRTLYERFTLDKKDRGIPPGHFLSGRMVQAMKRASSITQDQIIELIKNPFNFLHLYNKAAKEENLRTIPQPLLEKTKAFLAKIQQKS